MDNAPQRETIAIIGSGWAGYNLAQALDPRKFSVLIISPEATSSLTPLLASAACGLFNSQLAQEPVRRLGHNVNYVQAWVDDINFEEKVLTCHPAFQHLGEKQMLVKYDKVVVAPGCRTNTFGTPGVVENAFFVKNVDDANAIRGRINNLLEMASLPCTSEARQSDLLHIIIVGGGPTGIEIAAELTDLFDGDFTKLYPHLRGKASVAVHDVAPAILSPFDRKLAEYATTTLRHHKVDVRVNSHITNVYDGAIETKEDGKINCGMVIWAPGNTHSPLVEKLQVRKSKHGLLRILTDDHLRILDQSATSIPETYGLGDAADIEGASLPTTAEVAIQKAQYLAKRLNSTQTAPQPFKYRQRAMVTYTGAADGVIQGVEGHEYTGYRAWLSWRAGNLFWTRSWRRKVLMCLAWIMDWVDGREISRR
ncbi:FAD/NAD(P)-binding domain-containing protein [Trichoderma sp. SZMC 28014]